MTGRIVTPDCERPNRMDGTCFFCHEPVGGQHKEECVAYERKVIVRAIVEYEVSVPNSWSPEMIEFHRNDGSWCSNNMLGELDDIREEDDCLCHCTRFEYVGESDAN